MAESGFGLGQREHCGELPVDEQSAEKEDARFRVRANAEELLIVTRLGGEVGELLARNQNATHRRRKVIKGDLDLCRPHSLMGWNQTLGEQVAFGIVDEQDDVPILVVLEDVLGERIQRFGDVSGSGKDCRETGERSRCHRPDSAGWSARLPGRCTLTRRHAKVNHLQRVTFLDTAPSGDNFTRMLSRSVQLVLHYDGAGFSGWQRQPDERTVQGVLETAVSRLCGEALTVVGAGRTDAGVHARGQAAGVRVPEKWSASALRRSMNAILPDDVWIAAAYEMRDEFHPRYSAVSRSYSYLVGTDDLASSPFRRTHELVWRKPLDFGRLQNAAKAIIGRSCFRAFAVKGTAPESDDHRCTIAHAAWRQREGGLVFEIRADRFLHHMVRFLVGTMLEIGEGRREDSDISELLLQSDNSEVSAPAPAHALFLDRVEYPEDLYLSES